MKSVAAVFALALVVGPGLIDCGRIIVAQPFGPRSSQNVFIPLVAELAKRGHHVTLITNTASSQLKALANVREIILDELTVDKMELFKQMNLFETAINGTAPPLSQIWNGLMISRTSAEVMYANPLIKKILREEQFDLVLNNQATAAVGYPLAWHFKAPFILISPGPLLPGIANVMGDSDHTEHVPFPLTGYTDTMTFMQRLINTLVVALMEFCISTVPSWSVRDVYRREFPELPSLAEIEKNVSLAFVNTHHLFFYPRVLPPQVVEVGGMHCRPAQPLPAELEEFVSSSEAGFIVFAIGSVLDMNKIPDHIIESFIAAFSRLPQRIIWQWKGQPKYAMPANIKNVAWLPQQDLIGHKGCRLFLSHCGLNSLQEAAYHGVPVLGLPLQPEQRANVKRAIDDGYGLALEWVNITEPLLAETLRELLETPRYADAAEKAASLFRDQPETPMERAVFWVEHLLQHRDVDHLRLGSRDLNWFQRNLIDVYAVLFVLSNIPGTLVFLCVRKCCCSKKKASGGRKNKKD